MNSLQLSISFHGQRDAPCRQAASAVACNLFPCATVSTGKYFPAEKPYVSDKMMAHLFERIAPPWAQSKMITTFSFDDFAGRKCDTCAISAQGKMKCVAQKSPAATNARSATLHARSSRTEMEKTQSRLLPSAARRRSLRSGSVPAVSPPALHFSARRTADRSSLLFFTMKPGDGNFQTFGNGRNFVIHQITLLPFNSGNRSLIQNNAFGGQPSGQIIL